MVCCPVESGFCFPQTFHVHRSCANAVCEDTVRRDAHCGPGTNPVSPVVREPSQCLDFAAYGCFDA